MSWRYEQVTGKLMDAYGEEKGLGYSGAPSARNDPTQQEVENVGPLPCGTYTITSMITHSEHGPYALVLTPYPSNNMFGRGGFLMHGDEIDHPGQASHGCIIMPRSTREAVWTSLDHTLEVV